MLAGGRIFPRNVRSCFGFALTPDRTEGGSAKFLQELEKRLCERILSLHRKLDYRVAVPSLEKL